MNHRPDDVARANNDDSSCRAFLLQRLHGAIGNDHAAHCAACASRVARHEQFVTLLRQRPATPRELSQPELLEGVFDRIVEHAEGPDGLAPRLRDRASLSAPEAGWPEPLLEFPLPELVNATPPSPSPMAWERMRRDLVHGMAAERTAKRARRLWIGAAGLAAAAALAFWPTAMGHQTAPTIVFLDLDKPPSADYPWLGGQR